MSSRGSGKQELGGKAGAEEVGPGIKTLFCAHCNSWQRRPQQASQNEGHQGVRFIRPSVHTAERGAQARPSHPVAPHCHADVVVGDRLAAALHVLALEARAGGYCAHAGVSPENPAWRAAPAEAPHRTRLVACHSHGRRAHCEPPQRAASTQLWRIARGRGSATRTQRRRERGEPLAHAGTSPDSDLDLR